MRLIHKLGPPGPPPRPGLVWHDETKRWRRTMETAGTSLASVKKPESRSIAQLPGGEWVETLLDTPRQVGNLAIHLERALAQVPDQQRDVTPWLVHLRKLPRAPREQLGDLLTHFGRVTSSLSGRLGAALLETLSDVPPPSVTSVPNSPLQARRQRLAGVREPEEEAVTELRRLYAYRVERMRRAGEHLPAPGERARARFAPNERVEALRPFVEEFWRDVLGTSYATSYVSDESTLDAWEHYAGGRDALIARVLERYGVDISGFYREPIPMVLARVRDAAT